MIYLAAAAAGSSSSDRSIIWGVCQLVEAWGCVSMQHQIFSLSLHWTKKMRSDKTSILQWKGRVCRKQELCNYNESHCYQTYKWSIQQAHPIYLAFYLTNSASSQHSLIHLKTTSSWSFVQYYPPISPMQFPQPLDMPC